MYVNQSVAIYNENKYYLISIKLIKLTIIRNVSNWFY